MNDLKFRTSKTLVHNLVTNSIASACRVDAVDAAAMLAAAAVVGWHAHQIDRAEVDFGEANDRHAREHGAVAGGSHACPCWLDTLGREVPTQRALQLKKSGCGTWRIAAS